MHQTHHIIASCDRYLEARGLSFDGVVIGGAALSLLGVASRLTNDCDILLPEIPGEVAKASQTFAREVRASGGDLGDDCSIMDRLPCKHSFCRDGRKSMRPNELSKLSEVLVILYD